MKLKFLVVGIIFLTISFLFGGGAAVEPGSPAPTFSLPDLEQNYISLRDYCGEKLRKPWKNKEKHVVIISFFATWCKPCMEEIPHLEAIAQKYRNRHVKIFLIDVGEETQKVADFISGKEIDLPVLIDRYQTVAEKYDALTLPRLFIIDKQGIIQGARKGFSDPEDFVRELTRLLDELLQTS